MSTQLEIMVNGHWLSMESRPGDLSFSTIWPGGSDQLSWTPNTALTRRLTGGEDVRAYYGGVPVFAGDLSEPDASQDQLNAIGAFRAGAGYPALDGSGNATKTPDVGIDQAISRGLDWSRPNSIRSTALTTLDTSQGPLSVGELLDQWAEGNTIRWGVDPYRTVYAQTDPTVPSFQTLPLDGGLGYALDGYASTLIGRYLDSSTSTYKTVTVTDPVAEATHGHVEDVVNLTVRGAITSTAATNILTSLLALGRAVPAWTADIELSYGDVLNMGAVPVALETVAAGDVLRVNGGYDLAQRLNGAMYLDVLIGRTELSGGTLTVQPFNLAVGTLEDAIAAALSK